MLGLGALFVLFTYCLVWAIIKTFVNGTGWERQFSFTVLLSIKIYKWESVIIILGGRAITDISSSTHETWAWWWLSVPPTEGGSILMLIPASILVVLRIIASYYGNRSKPAMAGVSEKVQVRQCSKKAKIMHFPSYQSSSLWRKIHSSPVESLVYPIFFSLVATMDLSWLTKQ